jgi:hypothetical protein
MRIPVQATLECRKHAKVLKEAGGIFPLASTCLKLALFLFEITQFTSNQNQKRRLIC